MQIVIDISEEIYIHLSQRYKYQETNDIGLSELDKVGVAIKNGKPLPKGCGRLIDADKLKTHFIGTEQGTDLEVYLEPTIINAPTIIEADKEE